MTLPPVLTLVAAGGLLAVVLGWVATIVSRRPVVGAGLVAGTTAFVGVWVALPINPYVPPACLMCLLMIMILAPRYSWTITGGDALIASAFGLVGLSLYLGSTLDSILGELVLGALPAYLVGRMLVERLGLVRVAEVFAVVWAAAAVLGVIEAVTSFNMFTLLKVDNALYTEWATAQDRAGLARVEGAFGHSIAFATCMAAVIPLVAITRWPPWLRMTVMTVLLASTLPSLSRTGIMCALLAYLLSLLLLSCDIGPMWRLGGLTGLTLASVGALPSLFSLFEEAGQEQAGSAAYRNDILVLVPQLRLLGVSPARGSNGSVVTWGGFASIDNQMLLGALRYGWAPVVLLMVGLALVVARTVGGRANAAQISLVSLIPAYITVAFITQLSTVVWLLVGMAVAEQRRTNLARRAPGRQPAAEQDGAADGGGGPAPQRGSGVDWSGRRPARA